MRRLRRFGLFPARTSGFTRDRCREAQFLLGIPSLVVPEIHGSTCHSFSFGPSRSRSRFGLSVTPPFGFWSASLASPTADLLCPLLTSARRSARLSACSVAFATPDRSPEVISAAFRAQPPDIRPACLMGMDFAVTGLLVPR